MTSNNDIYYIVARIKNHIAASDYALGPAGKVLCNAYALFLQELYEFSDTLSLGDRDRLRNIVSRNETLPEYVIRVSTPKEEEDDEQD